MKKLLGALVMMAGCASPESPMFQKVPPANSGVSFVNAIDNTDSINILNYIYYYNGAGVGAGDINNDGLIDLYFAGNRVGDALYLNKGNWQFEDVSANAGINKNGWSTGVAMVDINADGWLDIYVSRAGGFQSATYRRNVLYVNNQDGTFSEQAEAYGIADDANTTSSAFFDFDRDGDLDLYVMNHGNQRERVNTPIPLKKTGKEESNDHLYENIGGTFREITVQAGILEEGYGLGLAIADFNGDYWPDIFVANDFVFSDLLYINNQDGTFTERARDLLGHQSYNSMGCDVGDINNDGLPDLITLDMLPEDNQRQKTMMGAMNYEKFARVVSGGYAHQYMRNMLHLNNGERFLEVGRLAGIHATDWSWAPLFADFDQDGFQDLFVTNGYYKDITDKDFIQYSTDITMFTSGKAADSILLASLNQLREVSLPNYMFRNTGELLFENVTGDWMGSTPSLSNGAVYADLDNDGDLDLVTNELNKPAAIFKNDLYPGGHFLHVNLTGENHNVDALGAKMEVYAKGKLFKRINNPYRGFLGSMQIPMHFGFGELAWLDSARIWWPSGRVSSYYDLPTDTVLTLDESEAETEDSSALLHHEVFVSIPGLQYRHQEDPLVDFHYQPLLLTMLSREGPALAIGDLNGDAKDEVFVGGAKGQPSLIFYHKPGGFEPLPLDGEADFEDVEAVIADFNDDGLGDLLVASGGYEPRPVRIYLGRDGELSEPVLLPAITSAGALAVADAEGDGDLDIFIGGRFVPSQFPQSPDSWLLLNKNGDFEPAPGWPKALGMVTDAQWTDLDADGQLELVLAREWQSILVLSKQNGGYEMPQEIGESGLWESVSVTDMDGDGLLDIVAGNYGLNNAFNVSASSPMELYAMDFDKNGSMDPIVTRYYQDQPFPIAPRDALLKQIPMMHSRFFRYSGYANSGIQQLFTKEELEQAAHFSVQELRSGIFFNRDEGFEFRPLLLRAQFGPVQEVALHDMNGDNRPDMLLVGNDYDVEVLAGRQDAQKGLVLQQQSDGAFQAAGEFHLANARRIRKLSYGGRNYWVIAQNDGDLVVMKEP